MSPDSIKNESLGSEKPDSLHHFIRIFQVLWVSRNFIIKSTVIISIVSISISLILPKTFKSTVVILPQAQQGLLGSLGGLSGVASLAGLSVGQSSEQLFPDIVSSEAILKDVIYTKYQTLEYPNPVNLIEYWEVEEETELESYEVVLEKMRKNIDASFDRKTNIVTIDIIMPEAVMAENVLKRVVMLLDEFFRTKNITNAKEQRVWIETRLTQIERDLAKAENNLREFREKNRVVTSSPMLMMEQQRLIREIEINTLIFSELKKQFEIAKIEELKNIPIVNILDSPREPAKKHRPRRAIIVIIATFFGGIGACVYAYYNKMYRPQISNFVKSLFQPMIVEN